MYNYHQGDVILKRIDCLPEKAKFIRKKVVAYGEITGHKHCIEEADIYDLNGTLYLKNNIGNNIMTHEEHPVIENIPKGIYEVIIQEEYFPEGNKKVKD